MSDQVSISGGDGAPTGNPAGGRVYLMGGSKMSDSMAERVASFLQTLKEATKEAEEAKKAGRPFAAISERVSFVDTIGGLSFVDTLSALESVGLTDTWRVMVESAEAIKQAVSGRAGLDRSKGDEAAGFVDKALGMGLFAMIGEETENVARETLAAWQATAPKSSSKGGSKRERQEGASSVALLPFSIGVTCQKCGKSVVGKSDKDNLNSHRNAASKHDKDAHDNSITSGTPSFVGLTEALKQVMSGQANQAEGGNYMVVRREDASVAA